LLAFLAASGMVGLIVIPLLLGAYVIPLSLGLKGLPYGIVGFASFAILAKLGFLIVPWVLRLVRLEWLKDAGFLASRASAE
jgi:hypothetical protein